MNPTLFQHASRAALAALVLAVPALAAAQNTYSIVDLGTLGAANSYGRGINNAGQVVGCYTSTGYNGSRGFFYDGAGSRDIGSLGGAFCQATGINNSGIITGFSTLTGAIGYHAFTLNGTTFTDLGTLGGVNSYGYAINDTGVVAGGASPTGTNYTQAVFNDSAGMHNIGTFGGTYSSAQTINKSGIVAGYAYTTGDAQQRAFTYDGTLHDIGTLGGANSYAYGINDAGQVTGNAFLADSANGYHAFLYDGAMMRDLGTLGYRYSQGRGINNSGQIVGYSYLTALSKVGMIYSGGAMYNLNAFLPAGSGLVITDANAVNDRGWITGDATVGGAAHAYLMKPVSVSVSGRIALEGVPDLTLVSASAPVGTIHLSFRIPGATTEVYGADAALTATAGSAFGAFTAPNVPVGAYDIAVKYSNTLRVVVPNALLTGPAVLPDITLPAGDADSSNVIDIGDFGILVNAFFGDVNIPGSPYDSAPDFNHDGVIDIGDFGLMVNEFSAAGAP